MKLKLPFWLTFIIILSISRGGVSQFMQRNFTVQITGIVKVVRDDKNEKSHSEKNSAAVYMNNAEFFLKKSFYSDVFFTLKTDSGGCFDFNIRPGVYNIYFTNETSATRKTIAKGDSLAVCQEQYKTQSHGTLRVFKKGNSPLEVVVVEKANPCGHLRTQK